MSDEGEDHRSAYASSPCFLHELGPDAWTGLDEVRRAPEPTDFAGWRQAQRTRLIEARLAIPPDVKTAHDRRIARRLDQTVGDVRGRTVTAYWPMRGEPDLRSFAEQIAARGGRIALPVVVVRDAPMVFRVWTMGQPLESGLWNMPVPGFDAASVTPDIVLAPLVGFDARRYRLGYGGGYFDRTLAAMRIRPRVVGVGYDVGALETIHPQPHDVPMDVIVTEDRVVTAPGSFVVSR